LDASFVKLHVNSKYEIGHADIAAEEEEKLMGCIDSSIGMVMAVWVKKMSAYASSSVVCDQPERFF